MVREAFRLKFGKAKEAKAWYQKFVPLAESGTREIYNVVE